jgi:hypothetical protein
MRRLTPFSTSTRSPSRAKLFVTSRAMMESIIVSSRLLKKAHLPRWTVSPLAATYLQYVSLGLQRSALHLDLFEQPLRK